MSQRSNEEFLCRLEDIKQLVVSYLAFDHFSKPLSKLLSITWKSDEIKSMGQTMIIDEFVVQETWDNKLSKIIFSFK